MLTMSERIMAEALELHRGFEAEFGDTLADSRKRELAARCAVNDALDRGELSSDACIHQVAEPYAEIISKLIRKV